MIAMAAPDHLPSLTALQAQARWERFDRGDLIARRRNELLLLVKWGHVLMETSVGDGHILSTGVLGPDCVFCVDFGGGGAEIWLRALTSCRVGFLAGNVAANPFHSAVILSALRRHIGMMEASRLNSFGPAAERIPRSLRFLATYLGKEVKPQLYELPLRLTHERLASFAGCSRETVTRHLADLIQQGAVQQLGALGTGATRIDLRRVQQVVEARRREGW